MHIKRPTREGKGGIQDGILLEKKRILQKPDLLRGKGACGKETRRHSECQHAPRAGCARPGDEFFIVLIPFGLNFGPSWAPRGIQNRAFGRQGVPKVAKIASKKRSKKKLDFLIEF